MNNPSPQFHDDLFTISPKESGIQESRIQESTTQKFSAQGSLTPESLTPKLVDVANRLLPVLEQGKPLDARLVRQAMCSVFGGTDAEGLWQWKDAYEAQEVASILFVSKFQAAIAGLPMSKQLAFAEQLQGLLMTHTKRSEMSQKWQQFSTPLPLSLLAGHAASVRADDILLEPSAGTGLLTAFVGHQVASVILNEYAKPRYELLKHLFKSAHIHGLDGEYLNDLLPPSLTPSLVLMNPPFSTSPNRMKVNSRVTGRHLLQAFSRLAQGGRLVAITGAGFHVRAKQHQACFRRLLEMGQVVFTAPLDGVFFHKHGTGFATRLTVMDKSPDLPPERAFESAAPITSHEDLLALLEQHLPARLPVQLPEQPTNQPSPIAFASKTSKGDAKPVQTPPEPVVSMVAPLAYEACDWIAPEEDLQDSIYESYYPQSVKLPGAQSHPGTLVQSAAMASVAPPKPSYKPMLPQNLIREGILSFAQLESIIYAGEAHGRILPGVHKIDRHHDFHTPSGSVEDAAPIREVAFRQGWFLGDGTGCGKGRQVAGIILDNWHQGRRKAVWLSKNDKLLEDARRDWVALGGHAEQVFPLSGFKHGQVISKTQGILFMTYATLRSAARGDKISRLQQVVNWLGEDFDGCIMFDESHALANAKTQQGNRGIKQASQQGLAGLRLQHALPDARVTYVSATGATDVSHLAYLERLGLWGEGTAFETCYSFIRKMQDGGVAAMEVVSRDMKALGLYMARALSYDGVEVEMLEHQLTDQQIAIYDQFAHAYQLIHQNLHQVIELSNMCQSANAKSAAHSAFESTKQRFFNHILASMKTLSMIKDAESKLNEGYAVVVQIVSTGESLLKRRLADIPSREWSDLSVDITPREYVMDYLTKTFPTTLFEEYEEDGEIKSRIRLDADGNPVVCREALAIRDRLLEDLSCLPALPSALDQILFHFGEDRVAEVTGRNLRLVKQDEVVKVQTRSNSANLVETRNFMEDKKDILIFSDAGGTGRSYHADKLAKNQKRRVHYLLEFGWKADNAIQGLGRTNRTNQAHAPLFRPVATDVKGEKRFLSTIARRLDSLGAITKGQRQTGGQGMFRAQDNLESYPARAALRQLYERIVRGKISQCSLADFEQMTGLNLVDGKTGQMLDNLPPMNRFLNRVLALPIASQNQLFTWFEEIMDQIMEGLRESGQLETGVETMIGDEMRVLEEQTVYESPNAGSVSKAVTIEHKQNTSRLSLEEIKTRTGSYCLNDKSGSVALMQKAPSRMNPETGAVEAYISLVFPNRSEKMRLDKFENSYWRCCGPSLFEAKWQAQYEACPVWQTQQFTMITGLLLPIWDKLSDQHMKIRRLQTKDGQRFLGRILPQGEMLAFLKAMGLGTTVEDPLIYWDSLTEQGQPLSLTGGLRIARRFVMGNSRLEVEHNHGSEMIAKLKTLGCLTEIINYKKRVFIPKNQTGFGIFETLLKRYPVA